MKSLTIDLDLELSDLVRKIQEIKSSQILLIVPRNAVIFRNPVSLKILHQKSLEFKKDLQLFTSDETGQKIAQKIGMRLYHAPSRKGSPMLTTEISKLPPKEIKKLPSKKISITEISDYTRKAVSKVPLSVPQKKLQKKEEAKLRTLYFRSTLKKKTVLGIVGVTFIFFWLVFSIAVPSATVFLTPATNVLETTVNIIFADPVQQSHLFRSPQAHVIRSIPLTITFEENILHKSTGKVFTGSSASCQLKVLNERTSTWTLIPKTRFKDRSGIVFRSHEQVDIPPARYQVTRDDQGILRQQKIPGSAILNVTAEEFDEQKNIIGARGNLMPGTPLSLPGLSAFNQTLLSAVIEEGCKGGVTEYYSIITAEDLLIAKKKMEEVLKKSSLKHLRELLDAENLKRSEKGSLFSSPLELFDDTDGITTEIQNIPIPEGLEHQKAEELSVKGSMKVSGIAYEKQPYIDFLEEGMLSKVHPDKLLKSIDYDSSTSSIVYSDSDLKNLSKVKLSVTVRGLEEYNLEPKTEKGRELIDKILNAIPGKNLAEANYLMANFEEIQKAHITVWPFWKNELPTRRSSIQLRVE